MRPKQRGNAHTAFGECAAAFAGPVCSTSKKRLAGRVPNETTIMVI
jgi:hypothetical protein